MDFIFPEFCNKILNPGTAFSPFFPAVNTFHFCPAFFYPCKKPDRFLINILAGIRIRRHILNIICFLAVDR